MFQMMLTQTLALALIHSSATNVSPQIETPPNRCVSSTRPIEQPCTLPLRVSPDAAAALIGTQPWAWWLSGDQLTMIARQTPNSIGILCCAIQEPVEPIADSDLVGVTVRVPHIDEAFFDISFPSQRMTRPHDTYRGPNAPPAPERAQPLQGRISTHQIHSAILNEERAISVYMPAEAPEGKKLPVIYLADGATYQFAGLLEAAITTGRARPAIIVGIDHAAGSATGCARSGHCDRRNLEYLPHFSAEGSGPESPFGRHLRFVTEEVMPFVERGYPASANRDERVTTGFSSGAVWALSAAARRSDLFGSVIAMSPGGRGSVREAVALQSTCVYAGAGLLEPDFMASTRDWAEQARNSGAQVRLTEMASGHTHLLWELMFQEGLSWLLPSMTEPGTAPRHCRSS